MGAEYTRRMLEDAIRRLRDEGTVTLAVRVRPGARETAVTGVLADGSFKMDVAGKPEDGEANVALVRFLAKAFGVPADAVRILAGAGARRKMVKIGA